MAANLTEIAVQAAKPGSARREIPDGTTPGLYLVVQTSGEKRWAFRYRFEGRTRKLTLNKGLTLKEARTEAKDAASAVRHGTDPALKIGKVAAPADAKDLVEAVVPQFVEKHAKRKTRERSWREAERLLNKEIVPVFVGRRLSDLKRNDVQHLLDAIVDRGAPILANRVLAAFRRMCNWAEERGLTEVNPCDKVKAPSAEKSRDRVLDDSELRRVLAAVASLNDPFRSFLKMLVLTGQRRDEVANLKWSEINFEARLWTLPASRSKNHLQHTIPLSEPALEILNALPRISPYVFSPTGKTAVTSFTRAKATIDRATVDMPAWVFHDLRRTMVSGMAALGIALPVIEKVVNHTSGFVRRNRGSLPAAFSFDAEKRHALVCLGCSCTKG